MAALGEARSRFTGPCGRPTWQHIGTLLRCYEPRGATSCGSPMPRGEQIAKPTERETRLVGFLLARLCGGRQPMKQQALMAALVLGATATPVQGQAQMEIGRASGRERV